MRISALTLTWLLTSIGSLVAADAAAQNTVERGEITVHFNAIPSVSLSPEVARQYAITRSANRALLNVSVQQRQQHDVSLALSARVSGTATNLAGQRQTLALREVREGNAIYYLAEPRIAAGETLSFELSVTPQGEADPIQVRFQQPFFPQP